MNEELEEKEDTIVREDQFGFLVNQDGTLNILMPLDDELEVPETFVKIMDAVFGPGSMGITYH